MLAQIVVSGLAMGAIYALIALGYVLVERCWVRSLTTATQARGSTSLFTGRFLSSDKPPKIDH